MMISKWWLGVKQRRAVKSKSKWNSIPRKIEIQPEVRYFQHLLKLALNVLNARSVVALLCNPSDLLNILLQIRSGKILIENLKLLHTVPVFLELYTEQYNVENSHSSYFQKYRFLTLHMGMSIVFKKQFFRFS